MEKDMEEAMTSVFYYTFPIGKIKIAADESAILSVQLCESNNIKVYDDEKTEENYLIKETHRQLNEYFDGERTKFDLPLRPEGTEFQLRDWNALRKIPYGQTRSYKDIAEAIDCPRGYRAVGMANNKNPILIIIPCHRVIGANGSLVGFGVDISIKEYLLNLEKKVTEDKHVC